MSYADNRYWIVFNGEIYNFIEIRRDLEAKKYRFISDSDTEVILAAYFEWGTDCLGKFNGMWAFAIWDDREKSLFLARDRFGIKPLYYHISNDTFAFSSEMKGLFPILPEIRPNPVAMEKAKNNMFSYESTEDCLVEGIKRFPAGAYGIYENNRLIIKRWWNTLDHLVLVSNRFEEQVEQFRELFLDACRIRMRSDVPIGTCLSGGLDSSAVACSMSHLSGLSTDRQSKDWQHAFVATFPGSPIDEKKYARQVAEYCGLKVDYINIDPLAVINKIDQLLYKFEELYLTSPIPFMLTYSRVREGGVTVTLDGHGADELFGGYPQSIVTAIQDAGFNINSTFAS